MDSIERLWKYFLHLLISINDQCCDVVILKNIFWDVPDATSIYLQIFEVLRKIYLAQISENLRLTNITCVLLVCEVAGSI